MTGPPSPADRGAPATEGARPLPGPPPLGETLADLANELAQPLTGVTGLVELLLRRQPPAEWRTDLEAILREAQRCGAIVRALQDLVRQAPGETLPVSVAELFGSVAVATAERRRRERVAWVEELVPGVPEVAGNRRRLEQALEALVANALDAIAEVRGEGTLRLTAARDAETVALGVSDDGGGMSRALAARAFAPFFTTRDGHQGLGLTLVETVAAEHRGTVAIESRLGVGTTVRLRLPAWTGGKGRRPSSHAPRGTRPRRALMVARDPEAAEALAAGLDLLAWRYHIVLDEAAARRLLGRGRYDALVVDTRVSGAGGPLADALEREHGLRGRVVRVRYPGGPGGPGALDGPPAAEALAVALGFALVGQAGGAGWGN